MNDIERTGAVAVDPQSQTRHTAVLWLRMAWWIVKCAAQTTQHKWFVFKAGRKAKVNWWRLLTHDLSKYGPREIYGYARNWHGDKGDQVAWDQAWLHHQRFNDHHWEDWVQCALQRHQFKAP